MFQNLNWDHETWEVCFATWMFICLYSKYTYPAWTWHVQAALCFWGHSVVWKPKTAERFQPQMEEVVACIVKHWIAQRLHAIRCARRMSHMSTQHRESKSISRSWSERTICFTEEVPHYKNWKVDFWFWIAIVLVLLRFFLQPEGFSPPARPCSHLAIV